jgi:hypothetical protein
LLVVVLAAVMLSAATAPGAAAGGYAPNPTFDETCGGGVPCGWSSPNGTISTDVSTAHTSGKSLLLSGSVEGAVAAGASLRIGAGSYTASVWYRTTDPTVTGVALSTAFFEDGGSSTGDFADFAVPIADGGWHRLELAGPAGPETQQLLIYVFAFCNAACSGGYQVNFDDLSVVSGIAPNPTFDQYCAVPPCGWSSSHAISVDVSTSHTSGESLLLSGSVQGIISAGVSVSAGAGSYTASVWYRTTDPKVNLVGLGTTFFGGAGATFNHYVAPIADGNWHRLELVGLAGPGTQSLAIDLLAVCNAACSGGYQVNFDDVSVVSGIAPNPTFDQPCAAVPCGWSTTTGTISTDVPTSHTSGESLLLSGSVQGVVSATASVSAGAGSYTASVWYRTTDPKVSAVGLSTSFFGGAGSPSLSEVEAAVADGNWHRLELAGFAGPGTQSLTIDLLAFCNAACSGGYQINFDDLSVNGGPAAAPTAVTVAALAARRTGTFVSVTWRTRSEVGVMGFNIWRGGQKLNRSLIPARGGQPGRSYRFVDRSNRRTVPIYRLEVISVSGARSWVGPIRSR